jgi:hypothetical protein
MSYYRNISFLFFFLCFGCAILKVSKDHGSLLLDAVARNDVKDVEWALAGGANPNAKDKKGVTALMIAAASCNKGIIKKLWDAGASINGKDSLGNTMHTYALGANCPTILRRVAWDGCKDMSGLYSKKQLEWWQPVFLGQIRDAKTKIEERLRKEGRVIDSERLKQAMVVSDVFAEHCKQPFYFRSFADGTIKIPTLSVIFMRDLLDANWRLRKSGYESKVNKYVSMLKYRRVSDFSESKYPSPFTALGIPHTASGEARYDNSSVQNEIDNLFKGTLLFITAHEAAHIIWEHTQNSQSSPEDEAVADAFAFEMVVKCGGSLDGIGDFFTFASYWAPNGGDFEDKLHYRVWLATQATHPASALRMLSLGVNISRMPQEYSLGFSASDPRAERLRQLGLSLTDKAKAIDDQTSLPDVFWDALVAD